MSQTENRNSFVAKYAIALVIGGFSVNQLSIIADGIFRVNWVPFELAFIYGLLTTLIPVGIQWIFLDQKLPKVWFVAGLIGSVIAAVEHGFVLKAIQDYRYESWITTLQAVDRWFLFIALATFLQALAIRNKVKYSYWWVVANIVGLDLNLVMSDSLYWTGLSPYILAAPGFLQLMLMILCKLPFGILCGIFLYRLSQEFKNEE